MKKIFPALEEEVTLKAEDKYIQAFIMLLQSDTHSCGIVISCKRNADRNILGKAHDNPFHKHSFMILSLPMVESLPSC